MVSPGTPALRLSIALACAGLALLGCEPSRPPAASFAPPITQAGTDAEILSLLDRMRAQAGMNPRGVWETTGLARQVAAAIETGTAQRKGLEPQRLIAEARAALARAEAESPDDRAQLASVEERLRLAAAAPPNPAAAAPSAAAAERPHPPPPPGGDWLLTLRNGCARTVVLFFGKVPGRVGDYTSLGAGERMQYSGLNGQQIWLLDDARRGISSLSPLGQERRQILPDCARVAPD